ncbi:adenylate cyclase type 2 [Trichonephila clavipes]|nr:adenylate cyclase type 2 [Trichonephila clavipes]
MIKDAIWDWCNFIVNHLEVHPMFLVDIMWTDEDEVENGSDTPDANRFRNGIRFNRQTSTSNVKANISRIQKRQSSNDNIVPSMSRRGAIGYSLHQYKKMVSQVNKIMENTIDKMALSKKDQWFSSVGIQPLLLTFRESGTEKPYLNQPDPLYKHYLTSMLIIFLGITIIHILILSRTLEFWITYGVVLLLIVAACVFAWIGYIWLYLKKDDNDVLNSAVLRISRTVWKTTTLRVAIWLAISSMILFCSIVGLLNTVPLRMDFIEINSRGKRGELLGRIDRQNSRFLTAKTIIIKFCLRASFVELECRQRGIDDKNSVFALLDLDLKFSAHVYFME